MLRPILIILVLALLIGGGTKIFQSIPPYERAKVGKQIVFWASCLIAAVVAVLFLKAIF